MVAKLLYTTSSLFILKSNNTNNKKCRPTKSYVCQGFPLDPATGQIPPDSDLPLLPSESSFLLQGRCIPFDNDNRDWPYRNGPPQPTTLDISADNTKDVYRCFVTATKELNDAKIVYALLGYNSNSYVRAILDKCIVPGETQGFQCHRNWLLDGRLVRVS